jgi:hypothetical protein
MYQLHLAGGHCPLRGLDAPCARWELYEISITPVNAQGRRCIAQLSHHLPEMIRPGLHHLGKRLETERMVLGGTGVISLLMRKLQL